ncbi:MAG: hypothetical protein MI862_24610 [Desulfobacterales bacterium]|nr:hypothetical protein [Desulfobacterales bacterium]
MNMKEISGQVVARLQQGDSREKIYNALAGPAPKDAGKIAYCIASVPDEQLRQGYIRHNAALVLLLIAYSILTLITGLPIDPEAPTLFLAIRTVIPLIFSYFVFHFHGGVYRVAGIWFVIDLLETILLTGVPEILDAVKLLVLFATVVLMFLIARKVFPNLGVIGPKKDAAGHYLF